MGKALRHLLTLIGLAAAVVALVAAPASATAPKFQSASAERSGTNLVITFREIGLGNADIDYLASAYATAEYGCVNGGGTVPSAANKSTSSAEVTEGATFTPKNGTVNGSVTLTAPGPGSFTCPNGQTLTLLSVTYTDVTLTDTTNGVTARIRGTY